MNKILLIVARATVTLVLSILFASSGISNVEPTSYTEVSKNELKQRIENLNSEIDLRYTSEVHTIINTYIKKYRRGSERLLGLSEQFFPLYEAEFEKQGMPIELKYLSVIESSLKPNALSASGAAGLWQFMKSTGRLYGLRITNAVDERRDPIRSTQAASAYLKDLYEQFGDWTLALAAYNCGPGNVRKALKKSKEDGYWSLKGRGYLPKETRRYIPKYVAMSYLMNYAQVHNLYPEHDGIDQLATVKIYEYTSFKDISMVTGLSMGTIAKFNPSYTKWYIPRSSQGYYLSLPQDDLYYYLSQMGGFDNLLDLGYNASTLKGRYMLYGAMKRKLREIAVLEKPRSHHDAYVLPLVIKLHHHPAPMTLERTDMRDHTSTRVHLYQLKPQESLMDVAVRYDIKLSTLLQLNNIDLRQPPKQGLRIRLE